MSCNSHSHRSQPISTGIESSKIVDPGARGARAGGNGGQRDGGGGGRGDVLLRGRSGGRAVHCVGCDTPVSKRAGVPRAGAPAGARSGARGSPAWAHGDD